MKKKTPDPAAAELVSNREEAVRFAAAARQAFQGALPPSRVDEIMAEGFRIAEREALKMERAAKRRL